MAAAAAAVARAGAAQAPAWLRKHGPGRVASEMRSLQKSVASGVLPGVRKVEPLSDDAMVWRVEVIKFDADTPAGRKLNADLQTLGREKGPKHAAVVLELRFPGDYPTSPFFLRVVKPRMAMYSGHVTAGGSVCIEALTLSGGAGAWRSDMSAESVLVMALSNMLHAEEVFVRTAVGGGRAGPLRIDMSLGTTACLREYSLAEAQSAFQRTLANHGWGGGQARRAAPPAGPRGSMHVGLPSSSAAGAAAAGLQHARGYHVGVPAAASAPQSLPRQHAPVVAAPPVAQWPQRAPGAASVAPVPLRRQQAPIAPAAAPVLLPRQHAPQAARPRMATVPAAAAAAAAAAAPAAAKKRPAEDEVIDLACSDDDDGGLGMPRRPPAKQARPSGPRPAAAAPSVAAAAGAAAPLQQQSQQVQRAQQAQHAQQVQQRSRLSSQETVDLTAMDEDWGGSGSQEAASSRKGGGGFAAPGRPAAQQADALASGRKAGGGSTAAGHPATQQAEVQPHPGRPSVKEQVAEANAQHGLDLVVPPAHWQISGELLQGRLVLVDLPLPGTQLPEEKPPQRDERAIQELKANGCSRAEAIHLLDEHGGDAEAALAWLLEREQAGDAQLDQAAVAELMANGLSRADAEAALWQCDGNVDQAAVWAVECSDAGGAAAVARLTGAPAPSSSGRRKLPAPVPDAMARERQAQKQERLAQHRKLQEESASVLQRFSSSGGVARHRVQRIERVQHLLLYSDYCRRRAKIARETEAVGAALNERQLFHGADKETLITIIHEGFDHRVSNLSGALGAGNYFAESSSYSDSYSRMPKHSANVMPGYGYGAAMAGAAGWPALTAAQQSLLAAGGGIPGFGNPFGVPQPPAPAAPARRGPKPHFLHDGVAMLLCDVTLGIAGMGTPQMRRPADGCHSSSGGGIHAVYDNNQAVPAYIIHYK